MVMKMDTRNFLIRPAEAGDLAQLWPLVREFATSFEPEHAAFERSFHELVDREDSVVFVAEAAEGIIGYLLAGYHGTLFANAPVAWIEEVMVADAARRLGVGTALMAEAERWAERVPTAYIALATRRAREFYRALGYEESATFFKKTFEEKRGESDIQDY
jgi:GNAT superfamily N-acetyltransferase